MSVQVSSVAVGATAVAILTGQAFAMPGGAPVVISNLGSNPVFLGGPGVTATTGVQLAAGANLQLPSVSGDLYAIATTGSNTVNVAVFR